MSTALLRAALRAHSQGEFEMRIGNRGWMGMWLLASACSHEGAGTQPHYAALASGGDHPSSVESTESARADRELARAIVSEDDLAGTNTSTALTSPSASGEQSTQAGLGDAEAVGTLATAVEPAPQMGAVEPISALNEETCPATLRGLRVSDASITRGAALVFTAAPGEVTELRARLVRLASRMEARNARAMNTAESAVATEAGDDRVADSGEPSNTVAVSDTPLAPASALTRANEIRVVEIPRGARLELRVPDASDVRPLRAEIRESATTLREGRCPVSLEAET